MNCLATELKEPCFETENNGVINATGTVLSTCEGTIHVHTRDGELEASRAVSCLVEPEEGDLVLLAGQNPGGLYVLAVLERSGSSTTRISTHGGLTVDLSQGAFTVAASEGINILSQQTVSVSAGRVEARVGEGSIAVNSIQLMAKALNSTVDCITQKVKRVCRRITEFEHVRAGQIDYASEGNMKLHGENMLVTARELIKADGEQVHIG